MSPPISGFLPGEDEQQIERYRRMSIAGKWNEISALNHLEDERQRADVRARYGEVSEEAMRIQRGVWRLGVEMVEKVVGRDAVARTLGDEALPAAENLVDSHDARVPIGDLSR